MAEGKITVTVKEGTGFDAPWVVVSGDSVAEVRDHLGAVENSGLLADVGRVAAQFKGVAALGGTLGARPVEAPNAQQGQTYGQQPTQGTQNGPQGSQQAAPAGSWGAAPNGPQNGGYGQQGAPQGGGVRVVVDNFKNEWEYDVPGAPMTPRGPAIVKRGKGPKGPWRKWYDPCKGPEWFAQRQPKVDNSQVWNGEFING
jgi:hypothetical protein